MQKTSRLPEPHHVGDDQQRRVLQRQRVLTELVEGRVEVRALPLVLPGEVMALPDVGPAGTAGVLPHALLEAVRLARRIHLGRRRLAQQTAQVVEVLLRCRALLQRRGPPLRDEGVRCHGVCASTTSLSCFAIRALTTCLAGILGVRCSPTARSGSSLLLPQQVGRRHAGRWRLRLPGGGPMATRGRGQRRCGGASHRR